MSWRRVEQGIETQTLEIQPGTCPVCRKGLYRNVTFLTGGWARCSVCNEFVHYGCLSGGKFLKDRPRLCADCKAGRVRPAQQMPVPPPRPKEPVPEAVAAATASAPPNQASSTRSAPNVRDGITPPVSPETSSASPS